MRTSLCDRLGIDLPIFAFTHCRDVVVAVSKAGGLGVLGAVGFTPEQLREELDWIDAHIGDKPYAVDIVIPQKYEGMGNVDPAELEKQLQAMVPQEHHDFAAKLLREHGVPEWPDSNDKLGLLGWTEATASPLLDEALKRPKVKLIANALGTPPKEIIDRIHASGRLVARAVRQGQAGRAAQEERCGHHHRAGLRGRRPHRRGGLDRAVAADHRRGGARRRCWRRAASATAARSRRRWRWAPRACGPARCG